MYNYINAFATPFFFLKQSIEQYIQLILIILNISEGTLNSLNFKFIFENFCSL